MHQCGWCPTLLSDDHVEWYHHFLVAHRVDGYSVRPIVGDEWDIAELVPAGEENQ